MNICEKIMKARGSCIVEIKEVSVSSVESAAKLFGLSDGDEIYKKIDRLEAREVLKNVLHKDMAYRVKIMSSEKAKNLSEEFLTKFDDRAEFYTNGEYGKSRKSPDVGPSWSPATEATFDTGVIVISSKIVGCAWFADED